MSTSRIRRTPLLTVIVALAVALAGFIAVTGAGQARGDVPPTPGWNLQWSDDFNGANRTLLSAANWQIDLGHAYPGGPGNWGTGEIQNYTDNPDNVSLDGGGNLRITPLRDGAGNWTSGRIETKRADFKAPAGGTLRIEGRIQMPNVTGQAALGYWPAFWALGSPTAATTGTGRPSASSTSWRTSTASTPSGACCTAASTPAAPATRPAA